MSEFDRRTFLKLMGGSTAALSLGLPRSTWARENAATAKVVPGKSMETDVAASVGGVKINHREEVMTPDFVAIPGLYCG